MFQHRVYNSLVVFHHKKIKIASSLSLWHSAFMPALRTRTRRAAAAASASSAHLLRLLLCVFFVSLAGLAAAAPDDPEDTGAALRQAAVEGDAAATARALARPDAAEAVDAPDEDGNTALHWAAWNGHTAVVEALLAAGAAVDATDGRAGNTALMKAAYNGVNEMHDATARALLGAGADVDAKNVFGLTPLMNAAMSHGRKEMIEVLLQDGGADVHARDQGGVTALHKAAYKGHNGAIEALLAAGADVNAKRDDGVNPVMLAESNKLFRTVDLLKEHGAKSPKMKEVPLPKPKNAEL